MNNQSNIKTMFNKYADKYEEQYMSVDLYNTSLDTFCAEITSDKATILDVGCGPGNVTQCLLKQRPDFNILGIDIASNMITLAEKNNPSAAFKVMDALNLHELNTTYDGIVCGFLLPYLSKEKAIKFINSAVSLLKKEGVLYISTMEDLNSNSKFQGASHDENDRLFINYHEMGYLTDALKESGLSILFSTQQEYPQKNGTTTTDLIIIAKK
jgi:ubiquinone/menaquinone biosynthesis C-methylase UbiE